MKTKKIFLLMISLLLIASCATPPPKNPENICKIFSEHSSWYDAAKDMNEKWGTPIHVPMAMMYQESGFRSDAQPEMEYFLFIPTGRASSAYGYSQAKTLTWDDYQRETDNGWADRDDFHDAMDFMGWFTAKTYKVNRVSKWDAYAQYLNYHEGWGGYKQKTYNQKPWLKKVAKKIDQRSKRYARQLKSCRADLDSGLLWRMFFG